MKDQISKELFEKWLSDYTGLYVHVLPNKMSGLPKHLQSQVIVPLYIGLNTIISIPDLQVFETGWSGTLSFNRYPYFIDCPFKAIPYIVGDDSFTRTILFEQQVTEEILDELAADIFEPKITKEMIDSTEEPVSSNNIIAVDFRNRKRK